MSSNTYKVLHFKSIRLFLEAINQQKLNSIPMFHITAFSEMSPDTPATMPPYQKDFFQINFIESSPNSSIKLNVSEQVSIDQSVYFISPEHIYSWKWAKDIEGYAIYFDHSFLDFSKVDVTTEFYELFNLRKENILHLNTEESRELKEIIVKLYEDYHRNNAFKKQILQSFLLTLLFKLKNIYLSRESKRDVAISRVQTKYIEFQNLIKNSYITQKSVRFYAEQLFIGPNYLNEICQKVAQKTAKQIIQDHLLLEAQKLLNYSNADIAEIGFQLGYKEATHFTRFFKQQTGVTPKQFRRGIRKG